MMILATDVVSIVKFQTAIFGPDSAGRTHKLITDCVKLRWIVWAEPGRAGKAAGC